MRNLKIKSEKALLLFEESLPMEIELTLGDLKQLQSMIVKNNDLL